MKIIKLFLLAMLLSQTACAKSVKNMDEANEWFENNKLELVSIKDVLIKHPNIKRVDTELRLKFVPKYADFTDQDFKIYDDLLEKCKQLGIKNISIIRRGNSSDGDLITVGYTLFSEGFVNNGYAISTEFIPDESFLDKAKKHGLVHIPQSIESWYLVEYQN